MTYFSFIIICGIVALVILAICLAFLRQGAPFVPSHDARVAAIVACLKMIPAQRIVDLGSGDGQLVIALAQAGYQVDGVELQPWLVWRARRRLKRLGLTNKAHIYRQNLWHYPVNHYDTVVLYAIPHIMPRLDHKLTAELPPDSHVISNYFTFPNRQPLKTDGDIHLYRF